MMIDLIKRIFGEFEYKDLPDGSIVIMGNWIKQNIVSVQLHSGILQVHRLLKLQLENVIISLGCLGKIEELDISHGGGGFVPRHQLWNPLKPLSLHSWGVAIDLNPKKYPYGSDLEPDKDLINSFKENGFAWGGDWVPRDTMHFQFRSFVK